MGESLCKTLNRLSVGVKCEGASGVHSQGLAREFVGAAGSAPGTERDCGHSQCWPHPLLNLTIQGKQVLRCLLGLPEVLCGVEGKGRLVRTYKVCWSSRPEAGFAQHFAV